MAGLPIWVVYAPGTDNQSKYTARLWIADKPTDRVMREDDLEMIRNTLRGVGLTQFARSPGDAPNIIESWF